MEAERPSISPLESGSWRSEVIAPGLVGCVSLGKSLPFFRQPAGRPAPRWPRMPSGGLPAEATAAPQLLCIDASSHWRSQLGAGRGVLPSKPGQSGSRSHAPRSSRVSAATSAAPDGAAAAGWGRGSCLPLWAATAHRPDGRPSPSTAGRPGRLRFGEGRAGGGSGSAVGVVRASRREATAEARHERARGDSRAGRAQISSPEIPRKRPRRAGRCERGRRLPPQEGHVRRGGRGAPPAPAPPPRRRARTAIKGAAALPDARPALPAAARSPAQAAMTRRPRRPRGAGRAVC